MTEHDFGFDLTNWLTALLRWPYDHLPWWCGMPVWVVLFLVLLIPFILAFAIDTFVDHARDWGKY